MLVNGKFRQTIGYPLRVKATVHPPYSPTPWLKAHTAGEHCCPKQGHVCPWLLAGRPGGKHWCKHRWVVRPKTQNFPLLPAKFTLLEASGQTSREKNRGCSPAEQLQTTFGQTSPGEKAGCLPAPSSSKLLLSHFSLLYHFSFLL